MADRRRPILISIAALALFGTFLGLSTSAQRPGSTHQPTELPLATAWDGGAIVAMGKLGTANNTFWESFKKGPDGYAVVTPTGVADNGGLISTQTDSPSYAFVPSQHLAFTPMANPTGILPATIEPSAFALTQARAPSVDAITSDTTLESGSGTHWTTLATATSITSGGCELSHLDAVTTISTQLLVGGACSHPGVVGIFETSGGRWRPDGPVLTGVSASQTTRVLMVKTGSCLMQLSNGSLIASWHAGPSGTWSTSPPEPLSVTVLSISTAASTIGVLASSNTGQVEALTISRTGASWAKLPTPPSGTQTISPGPTPEALAVSTSTLTVWRLESAHWVREQNLKVPLSFGSST